MATDLQPNSPLIPGSLPVSSVAQLEREVAESHANCDRLRSVLAQVERERDGFRIAYTNALRELFRDLENITFEQMQERSAGDVELI